MSIFTQIAIAGAMLLVAFGGGYLYRGDPEPVVQVVEREKLVEVQVKGETTVEVRDRIVTVVRTVKPDGTVTEKTRTEEKDQSSKEVVTEAVRVQERTSTTLPMAASRYSLGIGYRGQLPIRPPTYQDLLVTGGYRISSSPVWLEFGVTGRRELVLGLRLEW